MPTPESSRPSSKRFSDAAAPVDPVLDELRWMTENGGLRPGPEAQAAYDAQAEADREENLEDDYEWPGAD